MQGSGSVISKPTRPERLLDVIRAQANENQKALLSIAESIGTPMMPETGHEGNLAASDHQDLCGRAHDLHRSICETKEIINAINSVLVAL
jgi:hypothetical protein